jgi:hypothetical protein
MQKLGGRKFIFSVYSFTVVALLAAFGAITPEVFQIVTISIITGYLAANVSQKVFTKPQE